MTTPKDKVIPGTIVVITNVTHDSNLMSNKSPVCLTAVPGGVLSGYYEPQLGEELEILTKPKKINSINVVKVRYKENEYYTYYCSIRYMTKVKGS